MKIRSKILLIEIKDLERGECFLHENEYYIKTKIIEPTAGADRMMCINLETGLDYAFPPNETVEVVDAELVVR